MNADTAVCTPPALALLAAGNTRGKGKGKMKLAGTTTTQSRSDPRLDSAWNEPRDPASSWTRSCTYLGSWSLVASKTPSQVLYDVLVARYKQSNERTSLPAEMELRETLGVAFRIKGRPDIAINAETVRSVVTGPSPGDRKTKKKRADTALFCYRGMCKGVKSTKCVLVKFGTPLEASYVEEKVLKLGRASLATIDFCKILGKSKTKQVHGRSVVIPESLHLLAIAKYGRLDTGAAGGAGAAVTGAAAHPGPDQTAAHTHADFSAMQRVQENLCREAQQEKKRGGNKVRFQFSEGGDPADEDADRRESDSSGISRTRGRGGGRGGVRRHKSVAAAAAVTVLADDVSEVDDGDRDGEGEDGGDVGDSHIDDAVSDGLGSVDFDHVATLVADKNRTEQNIFSALEGAEWMW